MPLKEDQGSTVEEQEAEKRADTEMARKAKEKGEVAVKIENPDGSTATIYLPKNQVRGLKKSAKDNARPNDDDPLGVLEPSVGAASSSTHEDKVKKEGGRGGR